MTDKIFHVSGFTPTPYLKDLIDKHNKKVVIIHKSESCGPTVGIDIQKDIFYNVQLGIPFYSIENIERDIKKRSLPNYVKKSLSEANL